MKSVSQILKASKYDDKLSRPEWKAFAKDMRQQRGMSCESCRRRDVILQIHHLFYDASLEPWQYDPLDVVLLCYNCHKDLHAELKQFRRYVFHKLNAQSFKVLNGALAVALDQYQPLVFAHALAEFVSNPRLVQAHAGAWNAQSAQMEPKP